MLGVAGLASTDEELRMSYDLWLAFVAASTALLLIPGPTVLLVLSYALSQGRPVAIATAAGVALGDFVAMTASLVGLGALVLASATLFTVLKWVGAAYLTWLGVKLLRSTPTRGLGVDTAVALPERDVFWHAAAVTALNPKSIAFFIAFVPQFLRPDAALAPQFAVLIATFVTLAALNALAYALLADRMRARIRRPATLTWMNRAGGGALIGMGLLTLTLRRA
jgi:threonine/homoserine/homoserine lactone efflux protein